jgi:hypothetical protein
LFDDDWNDLNGWNGWNSNLISREWGWQWVFPATSHYTDRLTGEKRRHHLHESVLQRAFKEAR